MGAKRIMSKQPTIIELMQAVEREWNEGSRSKAMHLQREVDRRIKQFKAENEDV